MHCTIHTTSRIKFKPNLSVGVLFHADTHSVKEAKITAGRDRKLEMQDGRGRGGKGESEGKESLSHIFRSQFWHVCATVTCDRRRCKGYLTWETGSVVVLGCHASIDYFYALKM